jgi:hypothetical protein
MVVVVADVIVWLWKTYARRLLISTIIEPLQQQAMWDIAGSKRKEKSMLSFYASIPW